MLYVKIIAVFFPEIHTKHVNAVCGQNVDLLGDFAKCEKRLLSSCLSLCMFAWKNSALTARIFMKFDI